MSTRWLAFIAGGGALAVLIFWLATRYPSALEGDGTPNLLYYVLLLLLVASGFLAGRRMGWRFAAKSVAVWVLIAAALVLGYAYRFDIGRVMDRMRGAVVPHAAVMHDGAISVARGDDGHYRIEARVNDAPVLFLVDTGASDIVLSPADARRIGLDPSALSYSQIYATANGTVRGAPVRLDSLELAGLRFEQVPASVNEAAMRGSLLGMRFLDRFAGYEFRDGRLTLYP